MKIFFFRNSFMGETCTQRHLTEIVKFLEEFSFVFAYHATDLFVVNKWTVACDEQQDLFLGRSEFLPLDWMQWIDDLGKSDLTGFFSQLAQAVNSEDHEAPLPGEDAMPESLKKYLRGCQRLAINRRIKTYAKPIQRLGVSVKKSHEIELLAALIDSTIKDQNLLHPLIIDIGAGQGYLDNILASRYGYTVFAIDKSQTQTEGAIRRSSAKQSIGCVVNLTLAVHENLKLHDEISRLTSESSNILPPETKSKCRVYVSLHACGDLTSKLLHTYHDDPHSAALIGVGCCYSLLTSSGDSAQTFPLSQQLILHNFDMTQAAKMLACQTTWKWGRSQSREEVESMFTHQFYRALLQVLLSKNDLLIGENGYLATPIAVGKLRPKAYASFVAYIRASLKKLNLDGSDYAIGANSDSTLKQQNFKTKFASTRLEVTDKELNDLHAHYSQQGLRRLQAVWTLRALVSGVLESVILLDRLEFLHQDSRYDSSLVPVFDYQISPRNMVLVSIKR